MDEASFSETTRRYNLQDRHLNGLCYENRKPTNKYPVVMKPQEEMIPGQVMWDLWWTK
jgi:hypothetical protein